MQKTIRHLRIGFLCLTFLILGIGSEFAWRSWNTEKEHELLYLSSLVEITGKSLDGYFANQARSLRQLRADMQGSGHPFVSKATRALLKRAKEANPDFLHVNLLQPDGHMLVSDDADPGGLLPFIGNDESFQLGLRAIESGREFDIGRPKIASHGGEWSIPLRLGIRDERGQLLFILSATLLVSQQQVFWQGVPLPPDSALGLIRDDGYLVSRYPVPRAIDYPEAYGKPRSGRLREYLVQNEFPERGVTEGWSSVTKSDCLFAFHRLSSSPLTVYISTPLYNVQGKWLRQAQFAVVLFLVLMIGGYVVYRWSSRQLLAWDAERMEHEARVEFLAQHDPLTQLPNRLLAIDRFQQAKAFAEREGAKVAVLFLDLDNFKSINDSLGHDIGDAMLQEVTARLGQCLRATDTLSRQGGDEFLVILTDVHDAKSITRTAEALLREMKTPFEIEHHQLASSVSIGVAVHPDDGGDFGTLLRKADTAMYNAKAAGRNIYRFYTEQMNIEADDRLRVRNWLSQALEQGQFVLHYQPQIDLATGAILGAEALIRLHHPLEGLVLPGRFIAVAEDSGLIVPIGDWVLREACKQAAAWRAAGRSDLVVAVNLSAVQFRRGDLQESVTAALAESGLPPSNLELELTESLLLDNTEYVLAVIKQLKTLGVRFSIDDFGTGYSSLAYLKRFSVDRLKIDQSFVRDLFSNPDDSAIVHAIIQMARSLGLSTIAEGVEDEATGTLLRELGCEEAQGYFFGRPMGSDQFSDYLSKDGGPMTPACPAEANPPQVQSAL
ncbi:MAG TPA: EAL domain-containing protein [Rhodocyclaceae bacterium]|nr:EAL domain-containing protein [Rhodocyclaceae bacterium]